MSNDFCLIHGYEHMKTQFSNPIPYCEACENERSLISSAEKQAEHAAQGWTPEEFWDRLGNVIGIFESDAVRLQMEEHGLRVVPAQPEASADTVEGIAKWLHDETEHPESYPDHAWPETERDDGRREGGFVKIVPKHGQAYFRDIARRMVARFMPNEAEASAGTGGQSDD